MKKIWYFATILTLLATLFATTQVLAGPPGFVESKRTPTHTPDPQVTGQANQNALLGSGNSQGKRVNFMGMIEAVDESSLTLKQEEASSIIFTLNGDTRVKIPTLGRSAAIDDLKVGMNVHIQATQAGSEVLTARIVLVVPGKPTLVHRVGTVTEYKPGISITIRSQDGNYYTFLLTGDTKILPAERADQLKAGARVTVIAPRDVAGGTLTATGIVIHPPEE